MSMQSFTDLKVWQRGTELVCEAEKLVEKFPPTELYVLSKQLRASTRSITANIAEGFGKFTFPDKAGKYVIARGECTESESHILTAIALKYVTVQESQLALDLTHEIGRMLSGLISSFRKKSSRFRQVPSPSP